MVRPLCFTAEDKSYKVMVTKMYRLVSAPSVSWSRLWNRSQHQQQSRSQAIADLRSGSSCRSRGGRWGPSTAGTQGTPPWSGRTESLCSWASRTPPTPHSPHGWSCSGSGRHGNLSSCCRTHSDGPGSSCPRRRWSVGWQMGGLALIQSLSSVLDSLRKVTCFLSRVTVHSTVLSHKLYKRLPWYYKALKIIALKLASPANQIKTCLNPNNPPCPLPKPTHSYLIPAFHNVIWTYPAHLGYNVWNSLGDVKWWFPRGLDVVLVALCSLLYPRLTRFINDNSGGNRGTIALSWKWDPKIESVILVLFWFSRKARKDYGIMAGHGKLPTALHPLWCYTCQLRQFVPHLVRPCQLMTYFWVKVFIFSKSKKQ